LVLKVAKVLKVVLDYKAQVVNKVAAAKRDKKVVLV
jgi:hypothetical protein